MREIDLVFQSLHANGFSGMGVACRDIVPDDGGQYFPEKTGRSIVCRLDRAVTGAYRLVIFPFAADRSGIRGAMNIAPHFGSGSALRRKTRKKRGQTGCRSRLLFNHVSARGLQFAGFALVGTFLVLADGVVAGFVMRQVFLKLHQATSLHISSIPFSWNNLHAFDQSLDPFTVALPLKKFVRRGLGITAVGELSVMTLHFASIFRHLFIALPGIPLHFHSTSRKSDFTTFSLFGKATSGEVFWKDGALRTDIARLSCNSYHRLDQVMAGSSPGASWSSDGPDASPKSYWAHPLWPSPFRGIGRVFKF